MILGMASLWERIFPPLVTQAAAIDARSSLSPSAAPPLVPRPGGAVSLQDATSLIPVYRALDVLTVAASQLNVDSERNGTAIPSAARPAILRRPNLDMDLGDFVEQTILSLAVSGNFYWHKRRGPDGSVLELEILNPHHVHIDQNAKTGAITYHYDGKEFTAADMIHKWRMRLPGSLKGRSPIEAARTDLRGAIDARDYAGHWFQDTGSPNGVLKSDQALTQDDATTARNFWNGLSAEGDPIPQAANPSRVKVLGKGLEYQPITLSPKDAQWIEAQNFSVVQIARLFGVSQSLMMVAQDGAGMTYQNVEQDWTAFVRFTLMGYLRKIESAFTDLLPLGQKARFRIDALLRSDTLTRYQAHNLALGAWMTADEIRAIENLPPLTETQQTTLAAVKDPQNAN